jgi:hypothetical protein
MCIGQPHGGHPANRRIEQLARTNARIRQKRQVSSMLLAITKLGKMGAVYDEAKTRTAKDDFN